MIRTTAVVLVAALLGAPAAQAAPGVLDQAHTAGRVTASAQYTWPGVYFEGRFRGTVAALISRFLGQYLVAGKGAADVCEDLRFRLLIDEGDEVCDTFERPGIGRDLAEVAPVHVCSRMRRSPRNRQCFFVFRRIRHMTNLASAADILRVGRV